MPCILKKSEYHPIIIQDPIFESESSVSSILSTVFQDIINDYSSDFKILIADYVSKVKYTLCIEGQRMYYTTFEQLFSETYWGIL